MKVLQVNCVYKKGSTGKITADLHHGLLAEGVESVVCYGRGQRVSEPGVYKTCPEWYSKLNNALTRITGLMYGGCFFSTSRLISIIKREKPDIVHLQCINGYFVNIYRLVTWLKEHHIKTVLTLHAEFMYTANCGHALDCNRWKTGCGSCPRCKSETGSLFLDGTSRSWRKMKQAFDGFDTLKVVPVSKWIEGRARSSGILANADFQTIYNGIELGCFHKSIDQASLDSMKKKYGIDPNKKVVLHVTPSFDSPIKGGETVIALSKLLPQDFQCVVVGAKAHTVESIVTIPFVADQQELALLYNIADVMVMASKCDNYPTVCLEANCCGTPVVGFDVGGVKETIFPGMGMVVPYGDLEQLLSAVVSFAGRKQAIPPEVIQECHARNSKNRMVQDYLSLFQKAL